MASLTEHRGPRERAQSLSLGDAGHRFLSERQNGMILISEHCHGTTSLRASQDWSLPLHITSLAGGLHGRARSPCALPSFSQPDAVSPFTPSPARLGPRRLTTCPVVHRVGNALTFWFPRGLSLREALQATKGWEENGAVAPAPQAPSGTGRGAGAGV